MSVATRPSGLLERLAGWRRVGGDTVYSQNLRTFEELYDEGYIKADTYGITKGMLCGELLGFFLCRAVLTQCLCLEA